MRGWRNAGVAGLALGLLASCTWIEFADIERRPQQGTTFDRALYDGYLALSRTEYEEGDLVDQHRFADRARLAAAGTPFEPEALSFRELDAAQRGRLGDARFRLMKAFDAGIRENAPVDAAKAQVAFDCWMQEAEEGHGADSERCRSDFEAALARAVAGEGAMAKEMAEDMPALPAPRTIFFAFNSDALTGNAKAVLDQALADWLDTQGVQMVVSGFTDLAGDPVYNKALSERRAKAAVAYLVEQGFPAGRVSTRSFGEDDPAVQTANDKAETANRRVVISFEK